MDNDDGVTTMTADMIRKSVLATDIAYVPMLSLDTLEGMVERMQDWQAQNATQQPFQQEASVLALLHLMEEV